MSHKGGKIIKLYHNKSADNVLGDLYTSTSVLDVLIYLSLIFPSHRTLPGVKQCTEYSFEYGDD